MTESETAGGERPGAAGRARLGPDDRPTDYSAGVLLIVPDAWHTMHTLEDATRLLTTAGPAPPWPAATSAWPPDAGTDVAIEAAGVVDPAA